MITVCIFEHLKNRILVFSAKFSVLAGVHLQYNSASTSTGTRTVLRSRIIISQAKMNCSQFLYCK
jgi:hypothetical protein